MTGRANKLLATLAVLALALILSACDVPAAGKPMLYADQIASASEMDAEPATGEEGEAEEEAAVDFAPVASVGDGAVVLLIENHLGTTITSISVRDSGSDGWPAETSYAGFSIPNGSQFVLRLNAVPGDSLDLLYGGSDGTSFLAVGNDPASLAMDHEFGSIVMLCYDRGITYVEYTNLYGLTVDTHLSAQEAFEAMKAQLDDKAETFTFTEHDLDGIEPGQETENCLD